jgi:hypothetical protein
MGLDKRTSLFFAFEITLKMTNLFIGPFFNILGTRILLSV